MRVRSHPVRRVVGGLSVIAVTAVLAPAAAVPGFNAADLSGPGRPVRVRRCGAAEGWPVVNRPVPVRDVRRDDVVPVTEQSAPKELIFLVGFLGFMVLVELGVAVAVTL